MGKKQLKSRSISLIEILVVISIIAIISSFIFPEVVGQLKKARDARRKLDINLIQKALEQYYDSMDYYPADLGYCDDQLSLGSDDLIAKIPCDPILKTPYTYIANSTEGSSWFQIYAKLEKTDDKIIDLVDCRSGCGPDCQYNYGVSSPNKGLDRCTPTPTPIPLFTPTPTPIQYVCSPGGHCEAFEVPTLGVCPAIYPDDSTCQNLCPTAANRCKTSKGKLKPEGW